MDSARYHHQVKSNNIEERIISIILFNGERVDGICDQVNYN